RTSIPWSLARPCTFSPQMAIRSRLRKTVPPEQGEASHHTGGSSMIWKLGLAIVLAVIAAVVPALSSYWPWVLVLGVVVAFIIEGVRIVPQQSARVVERLGRFHGALEPGLHPLLRFLARRAYTHSQKERPPEVPEPICTT